MSGAAPSFLGALVRRPTFWFFIVGTLAASAAGSLVVRRQALARAAAALPVLSSVPAFEFTDEAGRPFSSKALEGQVWVANFIFTRCPTICPPFSAKMANIQKQSDGTTLRLITFTVDPEYDTPERLTAYAKLFFADPARWSFLTSDRAQLERVIVKGMMQPMDQGDGKDLATVVHGSYFVLVDGALKVRGYYKFDEAGAVDAVLRDARVLMAP